MCQVLREQVVHVKEATEDRHGKQDLPQPDGFEQHGFHHLDGRKNPHHAADMAAL